MKNSRKMYNFEQWILESKEINFSLWVSNLIKSNPNIIELVDKYINTQDPTIPLENLLDTLDKEQKKELRNKINSLISQNSTSDVTTHTQSIEPVRQKTLFKLFIKTLSFFENIEVEKLPKDGWLTYFTTKKIYREKLFNFSGRITSINKWVEEIPGDQKWVKAFWGVKDNGLFSYGFYTKEEFYPIQEIKFTTNFSRYISGLGSRLLWEIKRDFMEVDSKNLELLKKIKISVDSFDFPSSQKWSFFEKHLLHFAWYGLGIWNSGEIDLDSLKKIKSEIKDRLKSYRWSNRIEVFISASEFWIHLWVKIKQ